MKVKIKDIWYDSSRQPIMIRLSPEERTALLEGADFCAFPEGTPEATVRAFMGAIENKTFEIHEV